jgi:PAS domain S-box-containing protein
MTPRLPKPPKTQSRSAKSKSSTRNFRIAERHDPISKLEGGAHPHVVAVARRLLTEMEQALASMEQHYAASQERLAQLLSASPAVIYSFKATADFAPTFVSDNITRVFGYTPAEYLADPSFWRDRVHPNDLVRVEEAISAFLHNGIHAVEYRFRHKDGSYRWVNDQQRLIRGVDGRPFEIVGSWSDITARKAGEEEKTAAHVRLNQLLMSSPAVIYSYRATGDFAPTFVSQNIKDWLGYEPREYLESADFWRRCVHPDEIAAVEAQSGQLFKKGRHTVEYRFLKKDGSYCLVSDAQQLVRDEKGHPVEIVGSWSDITQLSHTVSELRALGEVSQAVNSTLDLETVLTTIVAQATGLSGTEAGAIFVFDEVQREFHLRATYGMDQALIDALAHQHIGLDDPNIKPALAHREPIQIADLREGAPSAVNEIILRAGFRALLVAPLLRGENIVGYLVVRRRTPGVFTQNTVDLIKTFAAQSAVAIQNARLFREIEDKSRQLEVAGQHKSQFLANMSHELRTPLNAIIGYSEILQEDVVDLGQESLVRDLKRIESSGRHLLGLINDILDLSKVEAGRMDIFLEDVEIVPLLEEVRAIIAPLAETKGNVLEFRLAKNLGSIRTDRTKFKQSLLNILSNGSKFTENGRLTVMAERFETDRPIVRFAISDTGIGMTEEQLGRLFQAFSQADASTSKKYGGTGLGLAISQCFCRLLGGDISVTSQPGEGSTFTITVPDQTETPAQINPANAPRISGDANSATTVLLVDDDPAAHDLLTASLKGAGYRLVHATSGAEALNLARTIRPDAITLDVIMPTTDGWEVLSALKADADLCDIPVVMVTIVPDRGIGLSLGAVDVLTKPVDRVRLTALMHRLVQREGSVLLVEDDADTRDVMRHTIEKMGLPVAEAANGRAALTWIGDHPAPSIILLDLMMPEMDGFEFLDLLASRAEWRGIPVIVVTAKQLTAVEHDRLLRQVHTVMEKASASKVDIAAAISEALQRQPARREPTGARVRE